MTDRDCRDCGQKLTPENARIYRGRWVGKCRRCEAAYFRRRYHAKKAN